MNLFVYTQFTRSNMRPIFIALIQSQPNKAPDSITALIYSFANLFEISTTTLVISVSPKVCRIAGFRYIWH